jgi:hypothetical protein
MLRLGVFLGFFLLQVLLMFLVRKSLWVSSGAWI